MAATTATEHGDARTPLRELLSGQIGAAASWELKVYYSEVKAYKYTWKGKEKSGRVKKTDNTDDSRVNTLVVEATPVVWDKDAEIPNDSVNALHGLQATGGSRSCERLVPAALHEIATSPFYNMTVAGEPAEKALVLLHFTERPVGARSGCGFRLITDNVLDGSGLQNLDEPAAEQLKVGVVARCTVTQAPDYFTVPRNLSLIHI